MVLAPLVLSLQILLWHAYSGAEEHALSSVVKRWNAAQIAGAEAAEPVLVQAVGIPYGSLADKLLAAIPRGHGPDLFIAGHDLSGEWARRGLLRPLDDLPAALSALPLLLPETLAPLRSGGHLRGLPLSFKSLLLFYRPDLTATAPRTTAELQALCQRLREQDPTGPRRFGLAYEAGVFFYHAAWLHGFGGSIFPPGADRPLLETKEELAALQFLQGLARRGDIPDEASSALVSQLFNQGRAATVLSGPWFLSQIEPGVPYAVAPLPTVSETGRPAAPLATIEAGFLSARSAHPAAAAAFLRYLVSPTAALERALIGRQAVSTASVWSDARVQEDPVLMALRTQFGSTVATDSRPEMRAFWEAGEIALRSVLRGAEEPARALHRAQQQLEVLLLPLPPSRPRLPYLLLGAALFLGSLVLFSRSGRLPQAAALWRSRGAYGYLAPAALTMLLLVFVPFLVGAAMSLYASEPDGRWRFVGLQNFADILLLRHSELLSPLSFYYTLMVTVLWTVLNVSLHVLIGGGLALLLRDPLLRLRGVYRTLLLLPWAVPNYITALIWKGMFNRQLGAVNGLLVWLGLSPVSWFSHFFTALSANVATNVWLGFPFMLVVAMGNLAQIPKEVEEAAVLDGASRWQRLRHVVLPMLMPAMLPSILIGAVWTFNMFNIVFLVSGGEPDGATDILVSQAYRWAFTRGHRYGYAAAYAVLIFLVLVLQSVLLRRRGERAEG